VRPFIFIINFKVSKEEAQWKKSEIDDFENKLCPEFCSKLFQIINKSDSQSPNGTCRFSEGNFKVFSEALGLSLNPTFSN
jgi:hypothetical protein